MTDDPFTFMSDWQPPAAEPMRDGAPVKCYECHWGHVTGPVLGSRMVCDKPKFGGHTPVGSDLFAACQLRGHFKPRKSEVGVPF